MPTLDEKIAVASSHPEIRRALVWMREGRSTRDPMSVAIDRLFRLLNARTEEGAKP